MRYLQFIGLMVLSLMILSCSGGLGNSDDLSRTGSGTATVIVNVGGRDGSSIAAPEQAPAGVASVRFYITGSDMDPIERTVLVTGTSVSETFDVPIGPNRHFEVFAYTANGTLYYYGDAYADLEVGAGGEPVSVSIILSMEGLSPGALLALCESAVSSDNLSAANDFCRDASDRYGTEVSNEADTARFFHVLTFFFDTVSDGDPNNGLNTASDILDAFNCTHAGSVHDDPSCPDTMPGNSPTGLELQNFLFNVGRPALEDIITTIQSVSQSFNYVWTEPWDGTSVESDFGDILVFSALAKGGLALLLMQDAYDLDADIDFEANNEESRTKQDFLNDNPNFGTLTNTGNLNTARNYLDDGANDLDAAIAWMDAESDNQDNDFINLGDADAQEIQEDRDDLTTAKQCLFGQCTVDDNETVGDTSDDTILDFSNFFSPGINLRALLPTIAGDDPTGFLPDPYMDGVFVQLDGWDPSELNNDRDGNGTADIFEEGIYYVYGGNNVSGDSDPGKANIGRDPGAYVFTFLGAAHTYDRTVNFPGAYNYYLVRSLWFDLHGTDYLIDSIYFQGGAGAFCCSLQVWDSGINWSGRLSADDDFGAWIYEDEYILMTAPGATTGIEVDGMPLP